MLNYKSTHQSGSIDRLLFANTMEGQGEKMAVRQDTITTVSLKMCPDYLPRLRKIATCLAGSAGMDPHETRALAASCVDTVNHESSLESNGIVSVTFVTCYGDAPAHPSQLAKRDRIERRKDQRTVQEQAAFAEQF